MTAARADAVIIATGPMLGSAVLAQSLLAAAGVALRVVAFEAVEPPRWFEVTHASPLLVTLEAEGSAANLFAHVVEWSALARAKAHVVPLTRPRAISGCENDTARDVALRILGELGAPSARAS
jgi:hypothetical protein